MLTSIKNYLTFREFKASDFFASFWGPFVLLFCFHQLFYGWILIYSNFVPYVMDGNETFSVFWHAHNLYNYSFWKSFGLTDEAFSFSPSAHPFFHTHQGNMPRLFGFLIYAFGARTVPAQVLITTLVIGNLTLFFCYAAVARITRPSIAFLFCLFLFSDYLLYAQWHVVTYRVWYGFLFFGTLFAIFETQSEKKLLWPYVLLGGLYFLLFYFELVYAGYVSIICGLSAIWLHWKRPIKIVKLYSAQLLGGLSALALLFFQLIKVFGLDLVMTDFRVTFLARNHSDAVLSKELSAEFFNQHNIVFWQNFQEGTLLRTFDSYLKSLTSGIFQIWTPSLFLLFIIPFLGIVISFFEPRLNARAAMGGTVFLPGDLSGRADGRQSNVSENSPVSLLWAMIRRSINFQILINKRQTISITFFPSDFLIFLAVFSPLVMAIMFPHAIFGFQDKYAAPYAKLLTFLAICGVGVAVVGFFRDFQMRQYGRLGMWRAILMASLASGLIAVNHALYSDTDTQIWIIFYGRYEVGVLIRSAIFMIAATAVASAFVGARRIFNEDQRSAVRNAIIFFIICLFAYSTIYMLAPGYVLSGYVYRLAPFAVFFAVTLPAIAIYGLIVIVQKAGATLFSDSSEIKAQSAAHLTRAKQRVMRQVFVSLSLALMVAVPMAQWTRVQIYYAKWFPPNQIEFARIFSSPQFKDATFAVNNYAAVVAYYSGNWAYMDSKISGAALDLNMHRIRDVSSIWLADWSSNPNYRSPKYYVCMKTPTFYSFLAQLDPSRFGHLFQFCNEENIVKSKSHFADEIVASDFKPPKFWSVVRLASGPKPVVASISTSVKAAAEGTVVTYKVNSLSDSNYPVQSTKVELLTAGDAKNCDIQENQFVWTESNQENADAFVLPKKVAGAVSIRAKVRSSLGDSDWATSRVYMIANEPTDSAPQSRGCATTIVAGSFASGGLVALQKSGWGPPEPWGTWSNRKIASLVPITIREDSKDADLIFEADIIPFIPGPHRTQNVRVIANGQTVAHWLFTDRDRQRTAAAVIPKELLKNTDSLSLTFEIPDAGSPYSYGISNDIRDLGIGIKNISLREIRLNPVRSASQYIPMRSGLPRDTIALAGWDPPTISGIAATDQSATVVAPAPDGGFSNGLIEVDYQIDDGDRLKQAPIEVVVNGDVVGRLPIGKTKSQFVIPGHNYAEGDRLLVKFRRAEEPTAISLPHDRLPITLHAIRLAFSP